MKAIIRQRPQSPDDSGETVIEAPKVKVHNNDGWTYVTASDRRGVLRVWQGVEVLTVDVQSNPSEAEPAPELDATEAHENLVAAVQRYKERNTVIVTTSPPERRNDSEPVDVAVAQRLIQAAQRRRPDIAGLA